MSSKIHEIDKNRVPEHIAIIMDGNGRWAKKKGFIRVFGHENGAQTVHNITEYAVNVGVKYLTLYAFSTENWNRPKREINALMKILVSWLKKEIDTLMKNNVRLNAIGNLASLPDNCAKELAYVMDKTSGNDKMTLTLALSYSSKTEIIEAVKSIARDVKNNIIEPDDVDDELISSHLYTSGMPDPELLIRTSGEQRISNYLLWQIAYSELYFTNKLWPEFGEEDFYEAIIDYQQRERRFGKISEQIKK